MYITNELIQKLKNDSVVLSITKGRTMSISLQIFTEDGDIYPNTETTSVLFAMPYVTLDGDEEKIGKKMKYDEASQSYIMTLTPPDTADIPSGRYYFDIVLCPQSTMDEIYEVIPLSVILITDGAYKYVPAM